VSTLIGMVQMFANMTDPSKLGPFMAVALLATFYGDRANVVRQILEAEACLRPTSTPLRQGRHRSAVP
jgi:flagellar motor component MotA